MIAPHLDGVLKKIHFAPNQIVKKGDLLFEFLTTEKEVDLEMELARLLEAKASFGLAKIVLDNKKRLRLNDVSSRFDLQKAQSNYDLAAAKVQQAKVAVHKAELMVKELKLYAPFDGMMGLPLFPEGIFLKRERQSQLARIIRLDPLLVAAEVPFNFYYQRRLITKTDAATLKQIELNLILPNGVRYAHRGRIFSGGFEFNEKTQGIRILAKFPNPDRLLRPGLKVVLESAWANNAGSTCALEALMQPRQRPKGPWFPGNVSSPNPPRKSQKHN